MMEKELEDYAAAVIQQEMGRVESYGLMKGKMGAVLLFFELADRGENDVYRNLAEQWLDDCLEHVGEVADNFDEGLHGIGWGIQYCIDRHFIEGDAHVILEDIDTWCLNRFFQHNRSFDRWLSCGIYFDRRIRYKASEEGNRKNSILRQQVIHMIDEAEYLYGERGESDEFVCRGLQEENPRNHLTEGMIVLMRLQQLDIFNYKVEKIQFYLLKKIKTYASEIRKENLFFLSFILEKWKGRVYRNFDIQKETDELVQMLSVGKQVPRNLSMREKLVLALWSILYGFPEGFSFLRGVNKADIEFLCKKDKYGLLDGLTGLCLGICKRKEYEKTI